ncbi:hypothetical protein BDB01DRAFT_845863 [Pilobolus umbonatus]|nr:hypothetical protein BDB01DRAFT_845863 [Pilobolus umbonatus]
MAFNLGTTQRQLGSIIEDFKKARDTWTELNSHGFPIANTLTNSVIQSRYVDEVQYWHPVLTHEFPNLRQKYDSKMQVIIQKDMSKLEDIVNKMAKQYHKMQNQYNELCVICDRTMEMKGKEYIHTQPMYETCPLSVFQQRMEVILSMYSAELEVKRSTVTGLRNIMKREEGLVLLSIWINQPSLVKSTLQEWEDVCTTEMKLTLNYPSP